MKSKTALIIMILLTGCGTALTVEETAINTWTDGTITVQASHYNLSDGSLAFVKLDVPDMGSYTLPQVLSGDGTRYTVDMNIVWWERGDTAIIQTRDDNGDWETACTLTVSR